MNELNCARRCTGVQEQATPSHHRNEDTMTVLRIPASCSEGLRDGRDDSTVSGARVRMRAQTLWRQQATMVSISGDVDAATSDGVQDFVTRFVLVGSALVLDLSGVEFIAAQGISVLITVDDACRAAEVSWALIPSRVVTRLLQLTACNTTLPTASSVPEALRQVSAAHRSRVGAIGGHDTRPIA